MHHHCWAAGRALREHWARGRHLGEAGEGATDGVGHRCSGRLPMPTKALIIDSLIQNVLAICVVILDTLLNIKPPIVSWQLLF